MLELRLAPEAVLQRITQHLRLECELGGYSAENEVQEELQSVYIKIANLIHATSADEIALVESATVAWTRLFYSAAQHKEESRRNSAKGKKVILVSEAEYAANAAAVCHWARVHEGWNVLYIPSETTECGSKTASLGKVNTDVFDEMLQGRYLYRNEQQDEVVLDPADIAMVCIAHVPTNSGIVNPVYKIGAMIADYNRKCRSVDMIFYFVDACQSVGQMDVSVTKMMCHGLAATGRKYLRAPRGTGFLYVSEAIVDRLLPHHTDHYSTPVVHMSDLARQNKTPKVSPLQQPLQSMIQFAPRSGAKRFEFWESSIALKLGLGCAVEEAMAVGLDSISDTIKERALDLFDKLQDISQKNQRRLILYQRPECGILTFWVKGFEPDTIKTRLWNGDDSDGTRWVKFEVSVVPATSTPIDSSTTEVSNLVRASVSSSTKTEEIDLFCTRIQELLLNDC